MHNILYEVCESSSDEVSLGLANMLALWQECDRKDSPDVHLLMGVLYILMLESGFLPANPTAILLPVRKLTNSIGLRHSYHVRLVRFYSQLFYPFTWTDLSIPYEWKFLLDDFGKLSLMLELITVDDEKLLNVSVVLPGLCRATSNCFTVSRYVPHPGATKSSEKFTNLKELSMIFKTTIWKAQGDLLRQKGRRQFCALENMPYLVLQKIAQYAVL